MDGFMEEDERTRDKTKGRGSTYMHSKIPQSPPPQSSGAVRAGRRRRGNTSHEGICVRCQRLRTTRGTTRGEREGRNGREGR